MNKASKLLDLIDEFSLGAAAAEVAAEARKFKKTWAEVCDEHPVYKDHKNAIIQEIQRQQRELGKGKES